MFSELFWPALILGALISLLILPLLIYIGLKKIKNPVPFWLPAGFAIAAFLISDIFLSKEQGMFAAVAHALLFFLLCALAIIIPLPLFRKKMDLENTENVSYVLIPAALVEIFCLVYSIVNQHDMMIGRPWTHAADRFPFLVGWLMDGVIQSYHATDVVYAYESPIYGLVMSAGFYLEVILVSGALYAVLCFLFPVKMPGPDP
jgi:hypothetical protein